MITVTAGRKTEQAELDPGEFAPITAVPRSKNQPVTIVPPPKTKLTKGVLK